MYSSDELFQRSRKGYFVVYFPSCEATRVLNTKIRLESDIENLLHGVIQE